MCEYNLMWTQIQIWFQQISGCCICYQIRLDWINGDCLASAEVYALLTAILVLIYVNNNVGCALLLYVHISTVELVVFYLH